MTGAELVAGYLVAWAVGKARRSADAGLDRLYEIVSRKLGTDPALVRLEAEAAERGEVAEPTRRRVRLAVERAADQDAQFASAVAALVDRLGDADDHRVSAGRNVEIRASGNGVAAGVIHGRVRPGKPRAAR